MKYVDFIAAGQKCGVLTVFLTLMATILGASATLGVAERAETIGFPAAWWLLSGAVGLALQGVVLSSRIRESGARTLPELAGLKVGASANVPGVAILPVVGMGLSLRLATASAIPSGASTSESEK